MEVEQQRPVLDIVDVMLDPRFHVLECLCFTTQPIDLRPARYSRLDPMPHEVAHDHLGIDLIVIGGMGTWADERHGAVEHVEELRELIEAGPPQEATNARHSRIVARGLLGPALRRFNVPHRPKLVDMEDSVDEAVSLLSKQDRSLAVKLDRDDDRHQQRKQPYDQSDGDSVIERGLVNDAPSRQRLTHHLDNGHLAEMIGRRSKRQSESDEVGTEIDVDWQ